MPSATLGVASRSRMQSPSPCRLYLHATVTTSVIFVPNIPAVGVLLLLLHTLHYILLLLITLLITHYHSHNKPTELLLQLKPSTLSTTKKETSRKDTYNLHLYRVRHLYALIKAALK